MSTPSGMTRHHALAVTAGTNGREEVDADFDFLSQQPGYKRYSLSVVMVFRICIALVLLILFILLVVDLSDRRGNNDDDGNGWLEGGGCLYAIGGGDTDPGSSLDQPKTMSDECVALFREYFKEGGQYWQETEEAIEDARGDVLAKKGAYKQMVILDIDETSLSNVPLSLRTNFNASHEERREWNEAGKAPAINATLDFYKELRNKGFSVAFITGRNETQRASTKRNLEDIGYGPECKENPAEDGGVCYYELVMRGADDHRDAVIYKGEERQRLEDEGFKIVASVGDQWSDLIGESRPPIIIKMPNPFYYLP